MPYERNSRPSLGASCDTRSFKFIWKFIWRDVWNEQLPENIDKVSKTGSILGLGRGEKVAAKNIKFNTIRRKTTCHCCVEKMRISLKFLENRKYTNNSFHRPNLRSVAYYLERNIKFVKKRWTRCSSIVSPGTIETRRVERGGGDGGGGGGGIDQNAS